jgi:hypothetical protein
LMSLFFISLKMKFFAVLLCIINVFLLLFILYVH